jgi:hypothetical protein
VKSKQQPPTTHQCVEIKPATISFASSFSALGVASQSNALGLWHRTLRYAAKSINLQFDDALELNDLSSQNHPEITVSAQFVWRGSILLARPWCPSAQRCAAAQNSTTGTPSEQAR